MFTVSDFAFHVSTENGHFIPYTILLRLELS